MSTNRDLKKVALRDKDFSFDTSVLSLVVSSLVMLAVGILALLRPKTVVGFAYIALIIILIVQTLTAFVVLVVRVLKAKRGRLTALVKLVFYLAGLIVALIMKLSLVDYLPIVLGVWAAVVGLSNIISFIQYAAERYSQRWKFLIRAVFYGLFAVFFFASHLGGLELSYIVVGVYLIIMAITTLGDAYASATKADEKELGRSRHRITPSPILTLLLPASMLSSINKYIARADDPEVDLSIKKGETEPNAEIFVHVATTHENFGHVDICVQDRVVAFGGYNNDTMYLGGILGRGTFFELNDREAYIELVRKKQTSVFGFGIVLKDSEVQRIWKKIDDIESHGYAWKPRAQAAAEKGEDPLEYHDYASRLYNYCGARFWQFKHGPYKSYFVLGTNCAKTADDLLSAGGFDSVAGGVITPGTYLDYMNTEFQRPGSRVVSRNVYSVAPPKEEQRASKKRKKAEEKAEKAKAKHLNGQNGST